MRRASISNENPGVDVALDDILTRKLFEVSVVMRHQSALHSRCVSQLRSIVRPRPPGILRGRDIKPSSAQQRRNERADVLIQIKLNE